VPQFVKPSVPSVPQPKLLFLQCGNALVSLGCILPLLLGTTWWTTWEWSAFNIGLVTTLANLCYGVFVSLGGRLADNWGRAKSGMLGCGLGIAGSLLAVFSAHPVTTIIAAMSGMLAAALFFPGSAGLFSDAEGANGAAPLPLHRKIMRYNLGWSSGNLAAFFAFGLLDDAPRWVGYGTAVLSFVCVMAILFPYRALPLRVTVAENNSATNAVNPDRAPHPALTPLTLMYRCNLFIGCIVGMTLITQLQKSLVSQIDVTVATNTASMVLSCYSACYIAMFILLGCWTGWILRPLVLWFCQMGFLLGAAGMVWAACCGYLSVWFLALCGGLIGSGYGAAYVGSIYYSLRLPDGVGRAAGLHETFIGLGNTMGPLLAGAFMSYAMSGMLGLSIFLLCSAACTMVLQLGFMPSLRRISAGK
jgi:MFS family permease